MSGAYDSDDNRLPEAKIAREVAVEDIMIPPASVGYIACSTPLVDAENGLFEPCQSTTTSRVLCPGIVKLHPLAKRARSIFIIQYINVEQEAIQIETGKTLGGIQPCTIHSFSSAIAGVTEGTKGKINSQKSEVKSEKLSDIYTFLCVEGRRPRATKIK